MENKIQKTEQTTPNQLIQLAIEGNADLEKLEKLLGLQERWEANEARKAFSSDFAIVQSKVEAVVKSKDNPQTHSKYAGLENVLEMSKPIYTKQGFSVIFYEGETEAVESTRICADVLHKDGHKEEYHLDIPLDGRGIKGNANMTKIHGKASSISYARRYLLCMIWNIPTQDDDGNAAGERENKLPDKPSALNKKVLAKICEGLQKTLPVGKEVDADEVAAIIFARQGQYPANIERVDKAIAWLLGLKQNDSWTKDTKKAKDTKKQKPLTEAEQVAEDKFGKEWNYKCNACGEMFDEPVNKGNDDELCPKCLSKDIIDTDIME